MQRDPDYQQNLMGSSAAHVSPFHQIFWKLVEQFLQNHSNRQSEMKKSAQMRCKHSTLAVVRRSQNFFVPLQTPFPGARDGQNLISWRWSLPLPTNPVGEDRCTQFRVIVVRDPQTHTPQTDRTDYNTLRCS